MEVILKKDVENLGFTDDIVEVKNGYGRNYLIPQGYAVLATASARKMHAETMRQRAHRDAKLIEDAKEIAKTLEDVSLRIMSKTGDGVKLFGSVNNAHVSDALKEQGHDIDKKFISIEGRNVKRVGNYVANIRLHRELFVDVPFEIYADPDSIVKKPKKEEVVADVENAEAKPQHEEVDFENAPKESIDDVLGLGSKKKQKETESAVEAPETEEPKEE